MASFHLSAQVIKRSEGRSAVAAAAYRAGAKLRDERAGETHDYSKRRGVAHAEVMAPDEAPDWMRDRAQLWNAVEGSEKRRDAQLAREINMALPHELTDAERLALVREYVGSQFVSRGMVADVAVHRPVPEKGDDPRNHHAHVMLTMRQAGADGFRRTKTREWNSDAMLKEWRTAWTEHQNRYLARGGHRDRVSDKSLAAQREEAMRAGDVACAVALDRRPELHVGARATAAARRGHRPPSRDRSAGPVRREPRGQQAASWTPQDGARRVVRYTRIDQGTRVEANAARLARNATDMARRLGRLQRQAALFRLRRRWLAQQEYAHDQHRQHMARQRERQRLWKRRQDEEELFRAWFRVEHVRKRKGLVDGLIAQVDAMIAGLLGIRERQLGRQFSLHRTRERPRQRLLGRERPRAMRPKGPSIF